MSAGKSLFLGTTNLTKIALLQAAARPLALAVLTPADLGLHLEVVENGQTPVQNAEIKARAYFDATQLPTLAIDGGLWVEKFPVDQQPGTQVKRRRGQAEAGTDQAILADYIHALRAVGGESLCTWEGGLALIPAHRRLLASTFSFQALLVSEPRGPVLPGSPLTSIMQEPQTRKPYSALAWEERPDLIWIRRFLAEHLAVL